MKSTLEDRGPWQKAISITLDPEEVEREMDLVVSRYQKKAVVPGFRKGKVPGELVRATYRESVESDLLNHLLPEATDKAVQEHSLQLAGPPRIQDLSFRPGEPLSFVALVDLWPQIQVAGYRGLELEEEVQEVDEPLVEEFLQTLAERTASLDPVGRASQPGDILEVSLLAVDLNGQRLPRAKRKELRMEAGASSLLPEFREVSLGRSPGDSPVIHIHYPQDFPDTELAGRQRHYRMKVVQILEKKLPEVDDSFARRIDGSDTLDALKAKIRLRLEAEERVSARRRTEEELIDRLISANAFDVPPSVVDRTLERVLEKAREEDPAVDEAKLRQAYTPAVIRARKREILLDSIARQESITVTEEELDEALAASAGPGVDTASLRRRLEREGDLERVKDDLLERKVFASLMEGATVHRIQKPRHRERQSNIIIP